MKPLWAALGGSACISSATFGIATTVNYFNYRAYWYGTIFAVQAVDFNILSKIAPTKLYNQVSTYANSVMGRLSNEVSANRVAVFSTIVFPDDAELSKVANEFGRYTRVVTLSHLAKTISEFKLAAVSKTRTNQPKRSPQQIEDLIYKRPMRRTA